MRVVSPSESGIPVPNTGQVERFSGPGSTLARMYVAEKRARADEVYVNDGTLAELDAWVGALVARLAP